MFSNLFCHFPYKCRVLYFWNRSLRQTQNFGFFRCSSKLIGSKNVIQIGDYGFLYGLIRNCWYMHFNHSKIFLAQLHKFHSVRSRRKFIFRSHPFFFYFFQPLKCVAHRFPLSLMTHKLWAIWWVSQRPTRAKIGERKNTLFYISSIDKYVTPIKFPTAYVVTLIHDQRANTQIAQIAQMIPSNGCVSLLVACMLRLLKSVKKHRMNKVSHDFQESWI